MIKHLSQILFLSGLCLVAWAQYGTGYFMTSENIQEVTEPVKEMHGGFLYRVKADRGYTFYRIAINNLLYSTKYVYAWPKDIPLRNRPQIQFFASFDDVQRNKPIEEIIFNEHFILADSKTLVPAISGSSPWTPQFRPGITLIASAAPAELQLLPAMIGTDSLPTFVYTSAETKKIILMRSRAFYSHFLEVSTPTDSFKVMTMPLIPLPPVQLTADSSVFNLDPNLPDSAKLTRIRNALHSIQSQIQADSQSIDAQYKHIRGVFGEPQAIRPYESLADYETRLQIHESEYQALIHQASKLGNIFEVKRSRIERLQLLSTLQRDLEAAASFNPQQALVRELVHAKLFMGASLLLGRNLPQSAADPGPANLWGTGAQLTLSQALTPYLLFMPALHFDMNRWHFHQEIQQWSGDQRLSLGIHLGLPLVLNASRKMGMVQGNLLIIQLGVSGGVHWTQIDTGNGSQSKNAPSWAAHMGLQASLTRLPLLVALQYHFQNNKYGALQFSLSIPLATLQTKRQDP